MGRGEIMNIGIDFDGVLFDSESIFRSYAQLFDLKINGKGMLNPEELRVQKRYDWSPEELQQFLDEYVLFVQETAPIMPNAKEVLNLLSKKHKLFAITNRGSIYDEEIDITKKRLEMEGIKFDKVIFYASNKLDICRELNIDIMIDDLFDTIITLADNGIKCLYYRDLVLKTRSHNNITEVRNWGDIAVELHKMDILSIEDLSEINTKL